MGSQSSAPLRVLGRYALHGEIAAGGMATVHFGRLIGPVGFSRTVAIKRLHPQFAKDPEFVSMFLDEARMAARIRHPNVVPTLDVVAVEGELFLVMDYVEGESLARVIHATRHSGHRMPVPYAAAILTGALYGLHAAHEATNEAGEPLALVHRDVSPQNVLVGADGVPRVLDFGVAKAAGRLQTTREGQLKGKMAYMAPEQLQGGKIDRRVDIFAAGVVLWEAITGVRLFRGESDAEVFGKVMYGEIPPPSAYAPEVPPGLDAIVLKSLARAPAERFESAHAMARALERSVALVPPSEIAEFVAAIAASSLAAKAQQVAEIEGSSGGRDAAPFREPLTEPSQQHPGTRVVPRAVPDSLSEPLPLQGLLPDSVEAPALTQLSSGSISQPRFTVPQRGVPVSVVILFASLAIIALAFVSLRRSAEPVPATATVWTDPSGIATAPLPMQSATAALPIDTAPPTEPAPSPPRTAAAAQSTLPPTLPPSSAMTPAVRPVAPPHPNGTPKNVLTGVLDKRH